MESNCFNKEKIREELKVRNEKAKDRFKRSMNALFGEDVFKKNRK